MAALHTQQLNTTSPTYTRPISTPQLQTPTQASIPTSHQKPAGTIEKRLLAPHHQGGWSRSERAPCMSKPKGAAGKLKNGWRTCINQLIDLQMSLKIILDH